MPLSAHGRPPFRADHIGSLLRPAPLRSAFRAFQQGRIDDDEFRRIQDEAIRGVVRLQQEVGLQVVTDGEFRRGSYWGRFVERVDGFVIRPAEFRFRDELGKEMEFTAPEAVAPVRRNKSLAVDEFAFLKPLTRATPKITLPAPSTMHFYRSTRYAAPGVYNDPRQFFHDLGRVFQEEIAALAKAGCEYVQLDEVALAMLCDPAIRARVEATGENPHTLVELYVDALNEAVKEVPANMIVGVHMCRGNFKGRFLSAGGYERVAEQLFNQAHVNHFLLEYDTVRAGDFAPLRFLPPEKSAVLGLVSSKTPRLELLEDLKRRVDEAARHIDLSRLAISPQCGFASTVAGNPLTEADEIAKLRLCVEAAEAIWGTTS